MATSYMPLVCSTCSLSTRSQFVTTLVCGPTFICGSQSLCVLQLHTVVGVQVVCVFRHDVYCHRMHHADVNHALRSGNVVLSFVQ